MYIWVPEGNIYPKKGRYEVKDHMELTIEFTKPFTDAVGQEEVTLEFTGTTVRELLVMLIERYPGLEAMLYSESGNITEYMIMFVNSKPISALKGIETDLKDGDKIFILFPISGG